jgi:hypothetical protein
MADTDESADVDEHCPNCGVVGIGSYHAEESDARRHEWDCRNDNCRVSLYFVEVRG